MGDLSAEPSMEEILSSIKRIIAEEGEQPARRSRPARAAAVPLAQMVEDDEVLELREPLPAARQPEPRAHPAEPVEQAPSPEAPNTEPRMPEQILSNDTAAATRGSLEALSRLLVKPEPGSDGTVEGLVRDMLRPMLREWLDANLPELVQAIVAREIKRITSGAV